ncbi:hypothetical protein KR038_003225, partial [Drosophila bunnanda]
SLAVNSSLSDTTGFSSAFIVQGLEPRLSNIPCDEVTPGRGTALIPPKERSQQSALGALALVPRHVLSNAAEGFAAKLAAKYDGPYKVVKFLSPNIVRLKDLTTHRRRKASINNLKPYHQHGDSNSDDEHEVTLEA